ncbi:MAG: HD domain-containing protein [Clostridiales bacterium]|nr:HD domain-containing protein [Clostridiales bacterium]
MPNYEYLTPETEKRILAERESGSFARVAFDESKVIRRDPGRDKANVIRTAFIRDCDKIIHCPFYNRYADKTQVFLFYKNDDISRRALHVQLVSRIARTIGKALNLNLDLIEAIALGHDIGHTPFGHAGETILDELYYTHAGRHFSHNIHSVRVLEEIYPYNISLQTLCGIAAHDGEIELDEYRPEPLESFEEFDRRIEACYLDKANVRKLVPSTLEGCVVRISDIIAYLGKDRQDAERARIISADSFGDGAIGSINAELINNLVVNIVENSYGKPYIKLDDAHFEALKQAKAENYTLIYKNKTVQAQIDTSIRPMMTALYDKMLADIVDRNTDSPIFTHHIDYVNKAHYKRNAPYASTEPNRIVVDYIAGMTDDYFVDLYAHCFPDAETNIKYIGYFD